MIFYQIQAKPVKSALLNVCHLGHEVPGAVVWPWLLYGEML